MLTGSRFRTYLLTSTALVLAVIYHTYTIRRQFYPTVIALTTNKVAAMVLCNEALVLILLFGKLCKRFFFGTLREAEVEHLYERSWCVCARRLPPASPARARRPRAHLVSCRLSGIAPTGTRSPRRAWP
jgi:hypothetical protein